MIIISTYYHYLSLLPEPFFPAGSLWIKVLEVDFIHESVKYMLYLLHIFQSENNIDMSTTLLLNVAT